MAAALVDPVPIDLQPALHAIYQDITERMKIEEALPTFLAGVPRNPPALELEQPCKDGGTVWTEAIGRLVLNEQTGHIEVYGSPATRTLCVGFWTTCWTMRSSSRRRVAARDWRQWVIRYERRQC